MTTKIPTRTEQIYKKKKEEKQQIPILFINPTKMISADLERLRLPHNQPDLPCLLVLEKLHCPGASLLPLIPFLIKTIQLRFPIF